MLHTNLLHPHDYLVAASIARSHGFTETEAALTELARTAVRTHVRHRPAADRTPRRKTEKDHRTDRKAYALQ